MARTIKRKRGAYRTENSVFVGAWFPPHLVAAMDRAVEEKDLDRSKLLRDAVARRLTVPDTDAAKAA